MKRVILTAAVLVMSALLLAGCGKGIRLTEIGPPDAVNSIMIASYPSEYKDKVTQGLVERYRERSKISLVPFEKLNDVDYRKFDVIVVIDALHAWQLFNARTRWFVGRIKEPEELKKVVLFFTAGKPSEPYSVMGIDTITAASEAHDETGSIAKIAVRIDGVLKKTGKKP